MRHFSHTMFVNVTYASLLAKRGVGGARRVFQNAAVFAHQIYHVRELPRHGLAVGNCEFLDRRSLRFCVYCGSAENGISFWHISPCHLRNYSYTYQCNKRM
jgi:hypothetical protein